jgi:hypothetical protein
LRLAALLLLLLLLSPLLSDCVLACARAVLAKIGTKADTPDFRDRMHLEQNASTALVKQLMVQLKRINREGGSNSAVVTRLTTQFDREFRKFQSLNSSMDQKQVKVIEAVAQRKYSGGMGGGANGHGYGGGAGYDEEDPLNKSSHASYAQQQQQQQQSAAMDITFVEYDIEELEKRQREIGQIEQDVLEVSEMYKDLQLMVHEQQENIDSIDASIVQAKDKTEAAHIELLSAEEYQKKSRKKKCCLLFLILGIVAVVVIIVFIAK